MSPHEIHKQLTIAFEAMLAIRETEFTAAVGMDTIFACGEALGIVSKAKALAGRDIDKVTEALREGLSGPTRVERVVSAAGGPPDGEHVP
jgi:hypothetical protein